MQATAQCAFGLKELTIKVVEELGRIGEKVVQISGAINRRGVHDLHIVQPPGTQVQQLQSFLQLVGIRTLFGECRNLCQPAESSAAINKVAHEQRSVIGANVDRQVTAERFDPLSKLFVKCLCRNVRRGQHRVLDL